jgi:uncharacterized protein YyaL (SSP411 family)
MTYSANPLFEIAIVGSDYQAKRKHMQKHFLPDVLWMGTEKDEYLALLEQKYVEGETRIYVCRNKSCKRPVTEVEAAFKQMESYILD